MPRLTPRLPSYPTRPHWHPRPFLTIGALALSTALVTAPMYSAVASATMASTAAKTSAAHNAKATRTFPAVKNATNLKKEPLPGKGRMPATRKLSIRNLVTGHGALASGSDTVKVQYIGTSYRTGKSFDSSWSRHQPSSFSLTGVVPGFEEGIDGMRVGGRREIVIPSALGYGASGYPPAVAPNETLVFIVDLLKVTR